MPPKHRVTTARIYDQTARALSGRRILIDRLWPRGTKKTDAALDEWLKDAAPSTDLRKWYDHDVERYAEFARRYTAELKEPPASNAVDHLVEVSADDGVILLTATRDMDHSGARVLENHLLGLISDGAGSVVT